MILADSFGLGEAFLTVLWLCCLFLWIAIAIQVFFDLFRDHDLSGWWKALWVIFIIFLPFLGVLVYLIARGKGMRERSIKQQEEQQKAFSQYVQNVAKQDSSPADELHKLHDLKEKGSLSEAEYEAAKAKVLGNA